MHDELTKKDIEKMGIEINPLNILSLFGIKKEE